MATASADFTGRLWNATNGALLHSFPQKHIVKAAAINEDSSLVAFGGKSKEVNVYSTSSYDLLSTFHFDEEVAFLDFCPLPSLSSRIICVGLSGKIVYFHCILSLTSQSFRLILDISGIAVYPTDRYHSGRFSQRRSHLSCDVSRRAVLVLGSRDDEQKGISVPYELFFLWNGVTCSL